MSALKEKQTCIYQKNWLLKFVHWMNHFLVSTENRLENTLLISMCLPIIAVLRNLSVQLRRRKVACGFWSRSENVSIKQFASRLDALKSEPVGPHKRGCSGLHIVTPSHAAPPHESFASNQFYPESIKHASNPIWNSHSSATIETTLTGCA